MGKEGIMGFHDIAIHPKNSRCNVRKFWKELKNKSKKEIIENRKQGWGGIGVIRKD